MQVSRFAFPTRMQPAAMLVAIGFALASLLLPAPAMAQKQDYFVPGQPHRAAPPAPARPAPPRPAQAPVPQADNAAPAVDVPMPPVPELPALPKGASPPAAVMGVIGVPEVLRASIAAQAAEKVIGERRDKLNEDAQKEQATWREMQQSLANERSKLSPDQIRKKEQELKDRITNAQKTFRERGLIIEEATQYARNQIQAELIAIIRQVSESHGMNMVLHRNQVALNVNEFDITDQVTEQLNKLLPAIKIPPDGVSPMDEIKAESKAEGAKPAAPAKKK